MSLMSGRVAVPALLFLLLAGSGATVAFPAGAVTLYTHVATETDAVPIFSAPADVWLNDLLVDPAQDSPFAAYQPTDSPTGEYVWEFPLRPTLDGDLVLDPAGKVDFQVCLGTGISGGYVVSLAVALLVGETVVAEGAAQEPGPVAGTYATYTWSETPVVSEAASGSGNLRYRITAQAVHDNLVVQMSEECSTFVRLPVAVGTGAPEGPEVEYLDAGDVDALEDELAFDSPFTIVRHYNWTTPLGAMAFEYALEGTGSVHVLVQDGGGTTVLDEDLEPTGTGEDGPAAGLEGEPGAWAVRLSFDSFQGNFSFWVGAPDAPEATEAGGPATTSPATDVSEAPAPTAVASLEGTTVASGKDSPIPLPLVLGAVALALLARRQRAP
ncbi:MAG TPA: hypothetical protein VI796_03045 [Candidatus Thermoplasmatota archaeon]|nr:hypothetical protein [Candidatus Thermoplasmatota archaeon]